MGLEERSALALSPAAPKRAAALRYRKRVFTHQLTKDEQIYTYR